MSLGNERTTLTVLSVIVLIGVAASVAMQRVEH
jgi:hypothetical protein